MSRPYAAINTHTPLRRPLAATNSSMGNSSPATSVGGNAQENSAQPFTCNSFKEPATQTLKSVPKTGLSQQYRLEMFRNPSGNFQNAEPTQPSSLSNRLEMCHNPNSIVNNAPQSDFFNEYDDSGDATENEIEALDLVEYITKCLADDPGNFDEFAVQIRSIFEDYYSSEYVMTNSMEFIFKRSIEDSNFRYMGAKLYDLLDKLETNNVFRNLLNCKLDFQKTEFQEYMNNSQSDMVSGTILFLAELFMQLKSKTIAETIILGINELILAPSTTAEHIKSICLTLKLSGHSLEEDFSNEIDQILTKLTVFKTMNSTTSVLIENVQKLQQNNWGRQHLSSASTDGEARTSDEPIYYGPDGNILTEDEASFLHMHSANDNDSDYEFTDMDEEGGRDFQKFLKLNNQ